MLDVMRFWLDRGVDGFRIDVAHMLMKDPELRDNPPNPDGASNPYDIQHPDFASQLHVHDRMHPDLHPVLRAIRSVVDEYDGDRVTIGEIEAMDWERWARYFGEDGDELQLAFAFRLIETPWQAAAPGRRDRRDGSGAAGRRLADPRARQPRPAAARDPHRRGRRRGSPRCSC